MQKRLEQLEVKTKLISTCHHKAGNEEFDVLQVTLPPNPKVQQPIRKLRFWHNRLEFTDDAGQRIGGLFDLETWAKEAR